jgi:hypothetical protein
MAKAFAYPLFRPDVDLGRSADQLATGTVANETKFWEGTLFQPRIWYNTYEFRHGYEGKMGRMLVQFPGLEEDRWIHMQKWLGIVEGPMPQSGSCLWTRQSTRKKSTTFGKS